MSTCQFYGLYADTRRNSRSNAYR